MSNDKSNDKKDQPTNKPVGEELNKMNSREAYNTYLLSTQKAEMIAKELRNLDDNIVELKHLIKALSDLQSVEGGEEILAPVANGIFVEATIKKPDSIKINVGNGVVVDKSIPETIEMLRKQEAELLSVKSQLLNDYSQVIAQIEAIERQVS